MPGRERQEPQVALDQGAVGQGIVRALALQLPEHGGYAGSFDLGLRYGREQAVGYFETLHRFQRGKLELAAFAEGWAGMARNGDRWSRDYGAIAGLRGTW